MTTTKVRLLTWKEVPIWQRDRYIISGYRPLSHSYFKSIRSLLYLHNQTINIWSHLLGLLLFATAAYTFRHTLSRYETASYEDKIVLSCFFAGVLACMMFSAAYHTFSNHSEAVCSQWLICDFLGILSLTAGSWVPGVYYGFYCQRTISHSYMALILSLSACCAVLCVLPSLPSPKWQPFRIAMFLSLGIAGFFPMTYAATEFGISQAHDQMGWGWFILEAVFYISGACIYVFKYPERAWPGSCDIVGSSHQIFHVLVLAGAFSHFTGLVKAFEYNHNPITRLCEI